MDGTAAAANGEAQPTTIFVGNLPWSATEEQISGLFADCGEVTGVRIGEQQQRQPRLLCSFVRQDRLPAMLFQPPAGFLSSLIGC